MRSRILIGAVLVLLLVFSLTSCNRQSEVPLEPAPPEILPPVEEVAPAEEATEEAAATDDPAAIVEEVGAPLFDGAVAATVETVDDKTMATYTTAAAYKEVKEFYLEKLQAPDWTNNGFEMGVMGGDEWEFKSADGSKLVLVKRDSGADKTQIRFTVRPATE